MKYLLAGHTGMVGRAILRQLQKNRPDVELLLPGSSELDLRNQAAVKDYMQTHRPDCVILAAAKVGGIHANNTYPADFIYDNLIIQCNVIHQAHAADVNRVLFLGSSCIYPRLAPQPMSEDALLTSALEPTNEPYAIAKIAGLKLCESYNRQYGRDYRSVMPTNLYGPFDNFHLENAHVLPSLMRRFHQAKLDNAPAVRIWGTGSPRREFLHVDEMAEASVFVMELDSETYQAHTEPTLSHINVGSGTDLTILELAQLVAKTVGYEGRIETDPSKPDGTPKKLMNVDRLAKLGWKSKVTLEQGLADTYDWFVAQHGDIREV